MQVTRSTKDKVAEKFNLDDDTRESSLNSSKEKVSVSFTKVLTDSQNVRFHYFTTFKVHQSVLIL